MRRSLPLLVFTLLVLSIMGTSVVIPASAATTDRNGSFTTDRGTAITLNATLEHDGTDGGTPVLIADKAYTLSVKVKLTELGEDAKDFHDLEFTLSMTTTSLLGSGKPVYSAYYYDSNTRLEDEGDSKVYSFTIFLTGEIKEDDTNLDIEFKGKENVANRPDPSTSFTNLGYIVTIQPGDGTNAPATSGSAVENRLLQFPTSEGTNIRIEVDMDHEGLEDNKPTLISEQFYNITVNFTILDLGADPESVKDMEVFVEMEDTSITDYIPGNSAVKYFSAYGTEEDDFVAGDSKVFSFYLIPSTNLNDTEVQLNFKFKLTENIPSAFDNDEDFELTVECFLNKGRTNDGQSTEDTRIPFNSLWMLTSIFVILPFINKKKKY